MCGSLFARSPELCQNFVDVLWPAAPAVEGLADVGLLPLLLQANTFDCRWSPLWAAKGDIPVKAPMPRISEMRESEVI
jgi:hypothetical protein